MPRINKRINLVGKQFGTMKVLRDLPDKEVNGLLYRQVEIICECGKKSEKIYTSLRFSKSCGCLTHAINKQQATKHGMYKTRVYAIWANMKKRCYNIRLKTYKDYGARGITVCDEWRNGFESFLKWAESSGYSDNLTIDRIDVNGNYTPENCRWVTKYEQCLNKRNTFVVTFNGETKSLAFFCKQLGLNYSFIHKRINKYKWTVEKALTTPTLNKLDNLSKNGKYIVQKVLCENSGTVYASAQEAGKELGLNCKTIQNVCSGANKSLKGLYFKYVYFYYKTEKGDMCHLRQIRSISS